VVPSARALVVGIRVDPHRTVHGRESLRARHARRLPGAGEQDHVLLLAALGVADVAVGRVEAVVQLEPERAAQESERPRRVVLEADRDDALHCIRREPGNETSRLRRSAARYMIDSSVN